ncbi:hypothetical protein IIA94_03050, partial [Patescibacteria group bacterium]|nr:hypothetical protein [Patescibacteria group bacterium]
MNEDLSKKESTNSLLGVILIIFFLIALLSAGILLYIYKSKERLLVSGLEAGSGIEVSYFSADIGQDISSISLSQNPPYVEPEKKDDLTKIYSIVAVSTGEIEEVDLKDPVGNILGRATVLKVLSVDDGGKPKKLGVALQIFPNGVSANITPWFIKFSANFRGVVINSD